MDPNEPWFLYVAGAGALLMLAELIVPGLVLVFLGASALLISGAMYLGWLDDWMSVLTAWAVLSVILLVTLRGLVARWLPSARERANIDEDVDAYGTLVQVLERSADPNKIRISYRGTTWDAECLGDPLEPGSKARLVSRRNLVWIIEAADGSELSQADPPAASQDSQLEN